MKRVGGTTLGVLATLLALHAAPLPGEEPPPPAPPPDRAAVALDRGLAWLAARQEESGAFRANHGFRLNDGYVVTAVEETHPGISALAGLALLGAGGEQYAAHAEALAKYLRSRLDEDGMISDNGSRMESHGLALLFLAEMSGRREDPALKAAVSRAADFAWKCQSPSGGWGYAPFERRTDIIQTSCVALSLRAARDHGARVPRQSMDRAADYALSCAKTRANESAGSFDYEWSPEMHLHTRATWCTTLSGLVVLLRTGFDTDEKITSHLQEGQLERYVPPVPPASWPISLAWQRSAFSRTERGHYRFWFGCFLASRLLPAVGGLDFETFAAAIRNELPGMQAADGSFPESTRVGPVFATACACLALEAARP